jgi:hypothetical protein
VRGLGERPQAAVGRADLAGVAYEFRTGRAFSPKFASQLFPPGEVFTRHLERSIVETTYEGHCGVSLVEGVASDTPEILARVPGVCWLLDMSATTAVDLDCSRPRGEMFRLFRELGGRAMAMVLPAGPARMMVTASAFAAGLQIFERREDALAFLRAQESHHATAAAP